jgi:hypothetical protein
MANFTTIQLDPNTGTQGSPVWTNVIAASGSAGANEIRWSSTGAGLTSTGNAAWPADSRPASTQQIAYTYAFTADTTGYGIPGGGTPVTWANTNYHFLRWDWDAVGTFAAAPIMTMYKSTSHDTASAGDNTLTGGNSTDTSSSSYVKANLYGQVTSAGAPAGAPTNAPLVTTANGTTAATAGANWMTNYEGLMGDTSYITFAATPAATTAGTIEFMLALFDGPNLTPSTYTCVLSLKYSWT